MLFLEYKPISINSKSELHNLPVLETDNNFSVSSFICNELPALSKEIYSYS